jgi:PPP family 3-phenylpropionic acid transporter
MASRNAPKRFSVALSLCYGAQFMVIGVYMPFFTVWLKAIGIEAWWIGIIAATSSVARFTLLPMITSFAERRQILRGAIMAGTSAAALGLAAVGTQHQAILVFIAFAVTACAWTPLVPLTDAYALKGVARYGLSYGPLRLWGSAAFIAGALASGLVVDIIAAPNLIWVIVASAVVSAIVSLGLRPLDHPSTMQAAPSGGTALLRQPGFLAIIVASALIQGSHVAYYTFASITWQASGLDGLTIAWLWVLGVVAEIVVFALSPRFRLSPVLMMIVGGLGAVVRWIITAQEPAVAALAMVQLLHGLTFGITQLGTMALLLRHVPGHVTARGQGYLAACGGIVAGSTAILSGAVYAQYGQGIYYVMAAMALSGAVVIWLARHRLAHRF